MSNYRTIKQYTPRAMHHLYFHNVIISDLATGHISATSSYPKWLPMCPSAADVEQYLTRGSTFPLSTPTRGGPGLHPAFNCRILYGLYLPTVILTIIWYSITHSLFHSRHKTFLFCKSFPLQPSVLLLKYSVHGFPGLFTVISEHICFLLLVFLFLHFLVVGSVR